MQLERVVQIIRARWKTLLGIPFVLAALLVLLGVMQPRQYLASAVLAIPDVSQVRDFLGKENTGGLLIDPFEVRSLIGTIWSPSTYSASLLPHSGARLLIETTAKTPEEAKANLVSLLEILKQKTAPAVAKLTVRYDAQAAWYAERMAVEKSLLESLKGTGSLSSVERTLMRSVYLKNLTDLEDEEAAYRAAAAELHDFNYRFDEAPTASGQSMLKREILLLVIGLFLGVLVDTFLLLFSEWFKSHESVARRSRG